MRALSWKNGAKGASLGLASLAAIAACSSSNSPTYGGGSTTSNTVGGSTTTSHGSNASSTSGSGSAGAGTTGSTASSAGSASDGGASSSSSASGGMVTLTVKNFISWCSVTVNGGAASTAATVTASVPDGSTATIVATPASSSFQIGADPWFGVDQNDGGAAPGTDMGSGATETTTATVTVHGATCVSVCCQLPNNAGTPCPTSNPCP